MSEDTAPSDETDIRQLDEETIAKIAAGEVVERPASVVKELIENSLDAGAERIDVSAERGGIDQIAVTDDGLGMSAADLRMAVREHTTSKLADADALDAVGTLGFRGEALHTIGAVSRLTIKSTPRDGDGVGTELTYADGDVEHIGPVGHPEGTTVAVEELFFNTPARRKYLADPSTEFRHISRIVGRYALANPDVAVSLSHNDSETFATTGDGNLRSAIMAVYGRDVAEAMIPVEAAPDGPIDRIDGYVSHPETTRSRATYVSTFVNDRYVDSDVVREATIDAYGGQLASDRYPFAVLFVELPTESVDVNVHPRKMEVRFASEAAVRDAVNTAVEDALLDAGLIRSSAPRGRSAPDETTVEPLSLDDAGTCEREQRDDRSAGDENVTDSIAEQSAVTDSDGSAAPASDSGSQQSVDGSTAGRPAHDVDDSSEADSATRSPADRSEGPSVGSSSPEVHSEAGADTTNGTRPSTDSDQDGKTDVDATDRKFNATDQRTLSGDAATETTAFETLPSLRVLGQAHDTFIVAESPDGILLIDQHAADERIHYERLRDRLDEGTAQTLAQPVTLSLTPGEAAIVDEYAEALARLGFHVDRDDERLTVRSVPAVFGEQLAPERVRDVFETLVDADERAADGTVTELTDELLGDLACAPAVTGNTSLTTGSVTSLLSALDDCENPYACPHGRPTIVELEGDELEDRFERDYPGHGGRR